MVTVDTFGLVGTTIAEKYLVQAVVDGGGTAVVYRAFHQLWKRPVALKVFRTPPHIDDAARTALFERFVVEGRLLAELSERCSAVLQARDIGTVTTASDGRVPYMVLEWLEGSTLERVLEDEAARGATPRTLPEAMRLLDPIAQALDLAHRRGIVHRDVKPSNLFVVGDPATAEVTVKLLDFGIAKVVEDARSAGAFRKTDVFTAFTPAYGAPEQFSRAIGTTGPWTDVFALALVLLELASGRAPLPGDTLEELGAASTRGDERPSLARTGITRSLEVEVVFARAVTVDPGERYASVEAFWTDLRRAVDAEALGGTAQTLPESSSASAVVRAKPERVSSPREVADTVAAAAPTSLSRRVPRALWITAPLLLASAAGLWLAVSRPAIFAGRASRSSPAASSALLAAAPPSSAPVAPVAAAPPVACPETMVLVPAGSFFMGSDERDVEEHERPAHKVRLDAYCIDRTEVTAAAYAACVETGACAGAWSENDWAGIAKSDHATFDPLCNARSPSSRGSHPANCVSFGQARDFCAATGARLPSEAEWELAARGTDGRRYPWGDAEPTSARLNACGAECVAWGRKRGVDLAGMYGDDDGWPATAPVGSFPAGASPYGALDMTGNVWEWVEDRYGPYASAESHAPVGPATGEERVLRGGAWNGSMSAWVRPSYRFSATPALKSHGIGFRCARAAGTSGAGSAAGAPVR
jgi:formylglycine-generating enzyme required for sulfatase activity/tRNA A-37 threonylcarbamoyl transferase component Bud32